MKFIVSSSALLKQLSSINGVITPNPVIPILENFLFHIQDGRLRITASDLQTSVITELPVDAQEPASIAVPARILLETLKNLPEQPIAFSIDEQTYTIEITSNNGKYKLAGENATDFPSLPQGVGEAEVGMKAEVVKTALSQTLFATGSDELRPAMGGVYVSLQREKVTFVATDGHKLVRYIRTDIPVSTPQSVIIPRKPLQLLNNLLSSADGEVGLSFDGVNVHCRFKDTILIARLLAEKYPDYENAIPQNNPYRLTINRMDLLRSLKRVAIYANKTIHQVRFKVAGSALQVLAEDLDFSNEASEQLNCAYEGSDIEIGFNAKFFIEVLNNIASEDIEIHLADPRRAALIFPKDKEEGEDLLMLIMPVILKDA